MFCKSICISITLSTNIKHDGMQGKEAIKIMSCYAQFQLSKKLGGTVGWAQNHFPQKHESAFQAHPPFLLISPLEPLWFSSSPHTCLLTHFSLTTLHICWCGFSRNSLTETFQRSYVITSVAHCMPACWCIFGQNSVAVGDVYCLFIYYYILIPTNQPSIISNGQVCVFVWGINNNTVYTLNYA